MSKFHSPPERYYTLLGQFVDEYARIEYSMSAVLRISLGTSRQVAETLFSGTRVTKAIDFIKRFHTAKGMPLDPMLEKAFPKIAELTTVRDRLLHYGGKFEDGVAIATDRYRNIPSKQYWLKFTLEDLEKIVEDTVTANGCLVSFWLARRPRKENSHFNAWLVIAQKPWRYRFPAQANKQGRNQKTVLKPKRLPQSSRA